MASYILFKSDNAFPKNQNLVVPFKDQALKRFESILIASSKHKIASYSLLNLYNVFPINYMYLYLSYKEGSYHFYYSALESQFLLKSLLLHYDHMISSLKS